MNPIAFIAFLVGINTTPPPLANKPVKETRVEKPATKPEPGVQKRGGWDHN